MSGWDRLAAQRHAYWVTCQRRQGVTSVLNEYGEDILLPYQGLSEAAQDVARAAVGGPPQWAERQTVSQAAAPLRYVAGAWRPGMATPEEAREFAAAEARRAADRQRREREREGPLYRPWVPPTRATVPVVARPRPPLTEKQRGALVKARATRQRHAEERAQAEAARRAVIEARRAQVRAEQAFEAQVRRTAWLELVAYNQRIAAALRGQQPRVPPPPEVWTPRDAKERQWCRANGIRVAGDPAPHAVLQWKKDDDVEPTCSLREMAPPVLWSWAGPPRPSELGSGTQAHDGSYHILPTGTWNWGHRPPRVAMDLADRVVRP